MELNHHEEDPTQDEDEPDNEPILERPSNDTIEVMVVQTVNNLFHALPAMSEAEAWKALWQLSLIYRTCIEIGNWSLAYDALIGIKGIITGDFSDDGYSRLHQPRADTYEDELKLFTRALTRRYLSDVTL